MFIPNTTCTLRRLTGTDVFGKPVYDSPKTVPCGIVRLEEASKRTSIRTDSSASRGNAMEETTISRILFPANVRVKQGDSIIFGDFSLLVMSVWPRVSIAGKIDHWQADLKIGIDVAKQ